MDTLAIQTATKIIESATTHAQLQIVGKIIAQSKSNGDIADEETLGVIRDVYRKQLEKVKGE